jgi:uncharacterized protein (TIGR02145 family)
VFTDKRDGKTYKKVTVGKQVWMAENLNFAAKGSVCYENKEENCAKYGRLYNWRTAKKACPAGWRLPSDGETFFESSKSSGWTKLTDYVGGSEIAGEKLKSTSGWDNDRNGTDDYGFSALPGGGGDDYYGRFYGIGISGYWWSKTTANYTSEGEAWYRYMGSRDAVGREKDSRTDKFFSVRCVQD